MPQNAKVASPASRRRAPSAAAPAARSAASHDCGVTIVSGSIAPPPAAQRSSIESIKAGSWTRSSHSRSAIGGSRRSRPGHPASSSIASIARIRPAFSGCGPGSWSNDEGWRK